MLYFNVIYGHNCCSVTLYEPDFRDKKILFSKFGCNILPPQKYQFESYEKETFELLLLETVPSNTLECGHASAMDFTGTTPNSLMRLKGLD